MPPLENFNRFLKNQLFDYNTLINNHQVEWLRSNLYMVSVLFRYGAI